MAVAILDEFFICVLRAVWFDERRRFRGNLLPFGSGLQSKSGWMAEISRRDSLDGMRLYLSSFDLGDRPEELVALTGSARRAAIIVNALDHLPAGGAIWQKMQMGDRFVEADRQRRVMVSERGKLHRYEVMPWYAKHHRQYPLVKRCLAEFFANDQRGSQSPRPCAGAR